MRASLKNDILTLHFEGKREEMNRVLDPISNAYEGVLENRVGHNFPSEWIPDKHLLAKYKSKCLYVVGVYKTSDLRHELLHAKFYLDPEYRKRILEEWEAFSEETRTHLTNFLKRLGYSEQVLVDEYQAYRYSEPSNFFGIKL